MKILMIGVGENPSTFIKRHIDVLKTIGVSIKLFPEEFPEFKKHKRIFGLLCEKGILSLVPRSIIEAAISSDVVHYQWPGHLIRYYSLARKAKKPTVLSLRGRQITVMPHMPGQGKYVAKLRWLLPQCDAYHCVSKTIMKDAECYGLAAHRAWIITPAVDTEFFRPSKKTETGKPIKIVTVGALIWRKGIEYALLALRRIVDRGYDVSLTVIGEGNEKKRAEYTVRDLRLGERVNFMGHQGPERIRGVLRESDIFLLTSLSEGIANVVLEAMSCGLPVVATDAGGVKEAVTDGVEGFVVPPRDCEAIAEKLTRLIKNPELALLMGRKGHERAVRDFDIKTQGMKFIKMYKSLVK
jgi:colanic acid/amylovoran biosynthesis glycosyltransferase